MSTNDVKRYYWSEETGKVTAKVTRHGWHREMVLASDYDALAASHAELRAEIEKAVSTLQRIEYDTVRMGPSVCAEVCTDLRTALTRAKPTAPSDSLVPALTQSVALARDAARYRWLRDQAHPDADTTGLSCMEQRYNNWGKSYHHHFTGAELDAAIDRALAEEKSRG